ncbi:BppU family phage baseplate upper protein [Clostridium perfringens]|uniref:BppU family phage baseplate upper protein n=1 Tax=Clostridium perfringens TaxID=1502 RepID=UPI0018E491EA|nr:BppU family phage baseplate upper protein [Clostridium perfringens]ELC8449576.1 BppU family phage baseplate upper protein [Clostridium perfringens]MBI6030926.1 BppU family phage baseplate upper protein [Clostridium perfringens]MBI6034275.1 BppU family phage baseplate upper protein [Clostridium perfringens]MBI6069408.1 BppU family phage baseplate upper protein [Clostridium perfringens]MBI6097582.1 BppU family phage baseplate upper protein [Clostridium perfringens]
MKEIYINADDYNSDSIKTIQGNNNAEEYKIYLQYDNEKIDLTGKTVNLAFLKVGSTEGDIIENLNVTNPKEGEITLKITNKISKRNGTYSCQLAILGEGDFLEHTATFTLTVENNIFSDITKAIADSKDFTYLENILDKASKLSEKLKENTSTATNANSNLESNITEANNINSKLLENTSTATSLNSNLESNINLAKEVKETIKDLDTKNTEATSNIGQLTDLNSKAQELSNNINKGLPLNSELIKNTESAKATNTNLLAANKEATSKNTELQASLEKTKEFIDGLDGSQNIPQIRMDVTELQNGLKSNQALSYEGSSISANDTLEGRTEGMRIGGRTLVNLKGNVKNRVSTWVDNDDKYTLNLESGHGQPSILYNLTHVLKENQKYTVIVNLVEYTSGVLHFSFMNSDGNKLASTTELVAESKGLKKFVFTINNTVKAETLRLLPRNGINNIYSISKNILILEGDWTNKEIPSFFEGLKSFGEEEKVGDKYKISILSHNKNLLNTNEFTNNKFLRYEDGTIQEPREGRCITEKFYELPENIVLSSSENLWKGFWIYDVNFKFIRNVESPNDVLVTKQSNEKYYRIGIQELRESILSKKVQLEERTIKTEYEPYKDDKKDILIKEPLKEREYIYEDNGQVKVCRKSYEYTLNGENEDWIVWTNSTGDTVNAYVYFNRMTPNLSGIVKPNSSNINDRLPANQGGYLSTKEGFKVTSEYFAISIHKSKLGVTNVNDPNNSALIKKWLKENPLTMVCQRATPVVEVVDGVIDIDLDTYQEKTYFNILNSLPGTLDFKVPSNLGSSLQNLAKEVNNIWDVINNLLVPSILDVNKKVTLATIKNNLK